MTLDFHTNKKIVEEVDIISSKRLCNKIFEFSTHLMKRIQKKPVRGISLKLQKEEREWRMIPICKIKDPSSIDTGSKLRDKDVRGFPSTLDPIFRS